jgi:hypothetical protein
MLKLATQYVWAADGTAQCDLIDDRPQVNPARSEAALALFAQHDQAAHLIEGKVTEGQDRGRLLLGLQQARHELGVIAAY